MGVEEKMAEEEKKEAALLVQEIIDAIRPWGWQRDDAQSDERNQVFTRDNTPFVVTLPSDLTFVYPLGPAQATIAQACQN